MNYDPGICIFNPCINCTEKHCYNCGWNPQVDEERRKKIREKMK